ncbi:MAG TPA: hypothetical protein PJ982_19070 [Lacipirellulaceae bacterium]|nr:hypothetical protein [Lacipirellulaceae bacterium]
MAPVAPTLFVAFIAFHLCALGCAWGTRLAIGSRYEGLVQLVFLAALGAVGLVAWTSHLFTPGMGIPSGATLIVMVLMAVGDFRRTHEPLHGAPATGRR